MITPEPVPLSWPPVTLIVTTLFSAVAAAASAVLVVLAAAGALLVSRLQARAGDRSCSSRSNAATDAAAGERRRAPRSARPPRPAAAAAGALRPLRRPRPAPGHGRATAGARPLGAPSGRRSAAGVRPGARRARRRLAGPPGPGLTARSGRTVRRPPARAAVVPAGRRAARRDSSPGRAGSVRRGRRGGAPAVDATRPRRTGAAPAPGCCGLRGCGVLRGVRPVRRLGHDETLSPHLVTPLCATWVDPVKDQPPAVRIVPVISATVRPRARSSADRAGAF